MTWKHDRGFAPMLATAARFAETHPDVRIEWEARSLQGFADDPMRRLVDEYDLVVLDHPFMGTVASEGYLVPLDKYLAPEVLATLGSESVGASHKSYFYEGHQYALAIDAASQVAGYRPDLLRAAGVAVPKSWNDVFELAKIRPGFVTTPLLAVDSMCSFLTLCANAGEPAFTAGSSKVVSDGAGEAALRRLKELKDCGPSEALEWNPIAVWEKMSTTDEIGYSPLAFGYSNYARPGYRTSIIHYTNIPAEGTRGPVGALLGGAGLGISSRCKEISMAVEYATWAASAACQRTLYFQAGGQPGNRKAWTDPAVNGASNDFFAATLPTLEQAYVRPRFPGFVEFQTEASLMISDFLYGKLDSTTTLRRLNDLYRSRVA
jgi:multiple sugar transport system substrate-binding protein